MFPAISNEGFPDSSVGEESTCNAGDPGSIPGFGKVRWRKDRLLTLVFLGFPCGSAGKKSACNSGDLDSIPGLGRSPGEGKGYHSSTLAWRIPWTVYSPRVRKESNTTEQLSLSLFSMLYEGFPGGSVIKNLPDKQEKRVQSLGQEDPLEKEMTTHSSFLT